MMLVSDFSTPVLLILFNRPDLTKLVFERIRMIKPRFLYVAADGPRPDYQQDVELCAQARAVLKNVDWECQIYTRFLDHNLGCGRSVSSAISWFFNQVEAGIIIEDDCIPEPSFFYFAQDMLIRYANDERIAMISGTNLVMQNRSNEAYFFARYYDIWGWATWRRAWRNYDFNMYGWPTPELEERLMQSGLPQQIVKFWYKHFNKITEERLNAWGYQWSFCCLLNRQLSIIPRVNLISNHGLWGAHANGTKSVFHELPTEPLAYNATITPVVKPDLQQEYAVYKTIGAFYKKPLKTRIREWIGL